MTEEAGEGPVVIEAPKPPELSRIEALEQEVQTLRAVVQTLRDDFETFKKAFEA